MTRRLTGLIALLLAFALFAVSCGDDDDGGGDGSTETSAATDDGGAEDEGSDEGADDEATDTEDDGAEDEAADGGEDGGSALEGVAAENNTGNPVFDDGGEPTPGGTLRVGVEAETDGLNPTVNRFAAAGFQMANAVFDSLVAATPDGEIVPYLAESMTPNEDLTAWDVKLREGITFHDGTPLNADALIANTEAQLEDALISLAVVSIFPEEGPGWEKIDDLTLRYFMRRPTAAFPNLLYSQLGYIASPAWIEAAKADETLNQKPVGTGPFVFDNRTPDTITRFVRNEEYWGEPALLDAIEFYPNPDPEVSAGQLIAGDLDSTHSTNLDATVAMRDDDSLTIVSEDLGEETFAMLNTDRAPFDDIRARQALTFAAARQDYIDFAGQGVLRGADSMFAPELPEYNPDVVQEGDDPDKAAPLIEEYCADLPENCTDGKIDVELQYSGPSQYQDRIADILEDGWSDLFNVERDILLQDDHITEVALGTFDIVTWRQFGAINPDPDTVWMTCESIAGLSLNWPRFCDPERDEALFAQRAATEEADRIAAWQDVARLVNESYTYIFFTHTLWANGFAENVRGMCDTTNPEGVELVCTQNGRHLHNAIWLAQ